MYGGGDGGGACFLFLTRTTTTTTRAAMMPRMVRPIAADIPGLCDTVSVVERTRGLKLGVTQLPDSLH